MNEFTAAVRAALERHGHQVEWVMVGLDAFGIDDLELLVKLTSQPPIVIAAESVDLIGTENVDVYVAIVEDRLAGKKAKRLYEWSLLPC